VCGRYTLKSSGEALARHFELREVPQFAPRYNIAPSQDVRVVRVDAGGERTLRQHRWGLVPFWAESAAVGNRMINARSETAATKPAFREALRQRRCLVPMDGFYEWKRSGPRPGPRWFSAPDGELWGVAGLWERWRDPAGSELLSCTLLTTDANAAVAEVHDRMPVVLSPRDYATWLDPDLTDTKLLQSLLRPLASAAMACRAVSERVNDPRFDAAECLDAPEPPAQGDLFGLD
jgi:putative SOS response-associated peptidase YedK